MKRTLASILFLILLSYNLLYPQEKNSEQDTVTTISFSADASVFCERCAEQAEKLVKYPVEAIENNISGTIDALLVIDKNGKVEEVRLLSKLGYGCDQEVERVSKMLTGFSFGSATRQKLEYGYRISFHFKNENKRYSVKVTTYDISLTTEQKMHSTVKNYGQDFSMFMQEDKNEMIKYTRPIVITNYIISQMGYELVTMEKFVDDECIQLKFRDFDSQDMEILLLLHKQKEYLTNTFRVNGTLKFPLIPANEDITVIVVKNMNGHPYFYIESFKTSQNRKIDMNYKRMTYSQLNKVIKEIE